ncbi:hypothetical protein [Halomonas sp. I5-271120]|uniref:hypothetical protein n=1 Tax=Halomonas sp. I5-271120 TaxID=3061632 RepID=UPI0027146DF6|nr:hypothetical protein [Halomonas sp. I5-271120]
MKSSVPAGTLEEEAFQQALVFAIYDYKLADAGKALQNGRRLKAISREAHGMSVKDLYANAAHYWQQELDVLQQAVMMGELKQGVTVAEAQAYIAKLQAMMSLGRRSR